jgi:hypothetical protein
MISLACCDSVDIMIKDCFMYLYSSAALFLHPPMSYDPMINVSLHTSGLHSLHTFL